MSALEAKLRKLAASLDTAALEALASKGLLRRAQKDRERGLSVAVAGETATELRVRVGDFEVSLPESGPANAKCSCPAAGVCQHIILSILYLQEGEMAPPADSPLPGQPPESASAAGELMAVSPEFLEKWAGKPAFRAGTTLAARITPVIVATRAVQVRFPDQNLEVHFAPGAGLDGAILSGGRSDPRQFVVAAVVAFQQARGIEWPALPAAGALEAVAGAPRTRAEVLESCQRLLEENLDGGLSRLSDAHQQRWATLAVSALSVNLPRLALLLRGLGDEAELFLARDARSDPGRTLSRMAQAHALCTALQAGGETPRQDLVGWHRTRYDEVGNLDLIGAAAWPPASLHPGCERPWRTGPIRRSLEACRGVPDGQLRRVEGVIIVGTDCQIVPPRGWRMHG